MSFASFTYNQIYKIRYHIAVPESYFRWTVSGISQWKLTGAVPGPGAEEKNVMQPAS